jgi:minor curlin subunit
MSKQVIRLVPSITSTFKRIAFRQSRPATKLFVLANFALVISLFIAQQGLAQDISPNSDLKDSELSLSLSTTVNFNGALGGSITIGQFGLYNTTNIIQAGSDTNVIEVTQQGNNNQADITQLGTDNRVVLLQEGENNLFNILQDGNGNIANVNQLGEQTFTVTQIGNEMVVNVTQYQQ